MVKVQDEHGHHDRYCAHNHHCRKVHACIRPTTEHAIIYSQFAPTTSTQLNSTHYPFLADRT